MDRARVVAGVALLCIAGGMGLLAWRGPGQREPTRLPAESASLTAASPPLTGADVDLLEGLTVAALGQRPPREILEKAATRIRKGESTVDAYIDKLVGDQVASHHAFDVLFDRLVPDYDLHDDGAILSKTKVEGKEVLALYGTCHTASGSKDATLADTEEVHPWWDLARTVTVCKDAHRPTVLKDPKTGRYCGTVGIKELGTCGCGPNLVFCLKDAQQKQEFLGTESAEARNTVGEMVFGDRPVRELFTTNETVRSMPVEMRYRRDRILAGEPADQVLADLPGWDANFARSRQPRKETVPGQHAGVLTMPWFLFNVPGARLRMQLYSRLLWCIVPKSRNVTAETVLSLHSGNLRTLDNWHALADRPVCNECHARLDYSMRFFSGYSWHFQSYDFVAAEHANEEGKVFVNGPDDLRGTNATTPRAYAEIATAQPEFGKCMADAVVRNVFGDVATDEDVSGVEAAFTATGTYKAMLVAALRARARRAVARAPAPTPTTPAVAPEPAPADPVRSERVALGGTLRELVDKRCITCHDEAPRDFRGSDVPRALASKMLRAIASHDMPKNKDMPAEERTRMITALVQASFPPGQDRGDALAYYTQGFRAMPLYGAATLRPLFAGGRFFSIPASDSTDQVRQYTPGFALGAALGALQQCTHTPGVDADAGAAVAACVRDRTRDPWVVAAPMP
jgi:hypothetical protein